MAGPVVLVTGASSGIGAALCHAFAARGCRVLATARRDDDLSALRERGYTGLQLDVTRNAEIEACIEASMSAHGRIDILVNNAGFGQMGPIIEVEEDALRAQFDTNVFAPLAMARTVAPHMRGRGGVIVNIGSVSGLITTPFSGAYCASKAALHAIDDALRMELAPFGIRVVTVQPGSIQSGFGDAAARTVADRPSAASWYAGIHDRIVERARFSQRGATPADRFARQVVTAVLRDKPPPVLRLGARSRVGPLVKRWLPVSLLDRILSRRFGLDASPQSALKRRNDEA